jgi:hypothetical protein
MSDQTSQDQHKIDAYLGIIQERILAPIRDTELRRSCTATLLLLFAAIDGLGKLLHSDDSAGPSRRIRRFLGYMGGNYAVSKKKLLKLRNSLVHNAINVESFLSNTEIGDEQHLKRVGAAGFVYVNTSVMYADFVDAFEQFRADLQQDPAMMKRAADRLEWVEESLLDSPGMPDTPTPTPPPPVEFILAKEARLAERLKRVVCRAVLSAIRAVQPRQQAPGSGHTRQAPERGRRR